MTWQVCHASSHVNRPDLDPDAGAEAGGPTPAATSDESLVAGQWQGLVYHEKFKQVLLVNGGREGSQSRDEPLELWAWDGTHWTLRSADPNGPRWRNWPGAAYDSWRNVLVIYGGVQRRGARLDDMWVWDGTTWKAIAGPGPGPREGAGMAYDTARGRVVLFGGANGAEEIVGDTWEWDGQHWRQVATDGPHPRFPGAMVYDAARERVLLFGGHFVGEPEFQLFSDVWAWDGTAWSELAQGDPAPDLRNIASVVFDAEHAHVVVFGGGETAFMDDIWAWDGTRWARIATSGGGLGRTGSAGTYDPVRHKALLSGGVASPGGPIVNDTWEWDGEALLCVDGCEWRWKSIRPNRGARPGGRAPSR